MGYKKNLIVVFEYPLILELLLHSGRNVIDRRRLAEKRG
jgi:hypothetical protein